MTRRIPAEVSVLDPRVGRFPRDSMLEVLFDEGRWLEGPAYAPQTRQLLFSDIPNDRTMRLDTVTGQVGVFEAPSRYANGRTFDREGRAVTCLHGARAVVRREHDGSETLIADGFGGLPLNSPNDVVVGPDGDIWFTDPTYGILSDYEGHAGVEEQPVRGLYRYRVAEGRLELVTGDFEQPNGLAFPFDGSVLYVVDSGRDTLDVLGPDGQGPARTIAEGRLFDGIRVDRLGRIWAATRDGVSCFDPDGTELVRLELPEVASNLCFGGDAGNMLYVTATTALYAMRTSVPGA